MKIHTNCEQGDLDWLRLHVGKATAGGFDQLVTPLFEKRTGDMPKTYLAKKLAEAWRGEPLPAFGSWQTDQGLLREEEAIPWFELEYGVRLQRMAFIEGDDGRCGCSPDAMISDECGLEVKCPESHTHVSYILNGGLPKAYAAQVHGSMLVTGAKRWVFLSYRRKFPKFVYVVNRDEAIIAKIQDALNTFYECFDAGMRILRRADEQPPANQAQAA